MFDQISTELVVAIAAVVVVFVAIAVKSVSSRSKNQENGGSSTGPAKLEKKINEGAPKGRG